MTILHIKKRERDDRRMQHSRMRLEPDTSSWVLCLLGLANMLGGRMPRLSSLCTCVGSLASAWQRRQPRSDLAADALTRARAIRFVSVLFVSTWNVFPPSCTPQANTAMAGACHVNQCGPMNMPGG
eukprot:1136311-Pelagomonas_calceolata.AAC.6